MWVVTPMLRAAWYYLQSDISMIPTPLDQMFWLAAGSASVELTSIGLDQHLESKNSIHRV